LAVWGAYQASAHLLALKRGNILIILEKPVQQQGLFMTVNAPKKAFCELRKAG